MLQKSFVNLNKWGGVGGVVRWSLITELKQVFKKKRENVTENLIGDHGKR